MPVGVAVQNNATRCVPITSLLGNLVSEVATEPYLSKVEAKNCFTDLPGDILIEVVRTCKTSEMIISSKIVIITTKITTYLLLALLYSIPLSSQ